MKILHLAFIGIAAGAAYLLSRVKPIHNIINNLPRSGIWQQRNISVIDDITIHHAASSKTATAYDFAEHHIKNKGWPGIGYHFVIDRQGRIYQTNNITDYSYHNGYDNKGAIGICMVGNLDEYPPTEKQYNSTIYICRLLRQVYKIKTCTGHKEYPGASTVCPGRYIDMDQIRQTVKLFPYGSQGNQRSLARSGKQYDPETADN